MMDVRFRVAVKKEIPVKNVEGLYRKPLEASFSNALYFLQALDQRHVGATVDLETLRSRLLKPLAKDGIPPDEVVQELVRDVDGGLMGSAGGRFFAWVIGGSLPAALAADWLTSAWDQNAGIYASSPAAALVEEISGTWLKEILLLPKDASFAFVTGCQMAHVTCLAAARHAVLARKGWDVQQRGLFGAPTIRLLTSDLRHGTFERAVRLLGLGLSQITLLPSNEQGALSADHLQHALESDGGAPTIVLLQAGDVNTGAYDSFETLIPIAKRYGAWIHVDGAFGLWAAASERYRDLVKGVDGADSWATDGHKWLNVPFDCGYAFVRDTESHRASISHRESYLMEQAGARDEVDWNPEWSRRARGFPTYAALRQLGRDGVAALVDNCCRHAHALVTRIGQLPGAEVLATPIINQGLVRFLHPGSGASEQDHDRRTDEVIAAMDANGEAFFGGTTWRGRRAMRVSVSGWQTTDEDMDRVVNAFAAALKE
jgi:glutamate/tyrosine decarboxylase-like PLP-dependent enzyme